jgi:hypothetical protein
MTGFPTAYTFRFTRWVLAAALIGTMTVAGSVWAEGSHSRAALGTTRIDVRALSAATSALPVMTIEQLF